MEIKTLQQQISSLLLEERQKELKFIKQKYFQGRNNLGKWLAYQLRKERAKRQITCLQEWGEKYMEQDHLKRIVHDFYEQLYKKGEDIQKETILEYLYNCNLTIFNAIKCNPKGTTK